MKPLWQGSVLQHVQSGPSPKPASVWCPVPDAIPSLSSTHLRRAKPASLCTSSSTCTADPPPLPWRPVASGLLNQTESPARVNLAASEPSQLVGLGRPSSSSGESSVPSMSTLRTNCPTCSSALSCVVQRHPVRCLIVAEPKLLIRHHYAKHCLQCDAERPARKYWCGYTETMVDVGRKSSKTVDLGFLDNSLFMLNKSFGVSVDWAKRWAYRLYTHRASFDGEATIMRSLEPDVTPDQLRVNLESAWVRYQVWCRADEVAGKQALLVACLLDMSLEELLETVAQWYMPLMRQRRVQAWRRSGDRLDICAIDGNAKLHRRTCGAPCSEAMHCDALGLHVVRGCPNAPLQRGALCSHHQKLATNRSLSGRIENHRMVAPLASQPFLELHVRLTGFANWQPACTVDRDSVEAYFAVRGGQVVEERKRRRQEHRDLGRRPTEVFLGDWTSDAVKKSCLCKTHKESVSAVRTASRSAGFLTAVSASGIVGALQEIITAETLSQRHCFLAEVATDIPELITVVHDDACHMRVFARCQAAASSGGSLGSRLALLRFIIDRPHTAALHN